MLDIVYFRYFAYRIQINLYDIYDISLRFRFQMQELQQCLLPYHLRRGFVFSHQKWLCLFNGNVIHVKANDFTLFGNEHNFVIIVNDFNGYYIASFIVNAEVLCTDAAAFLYIVRIRFVAFTIPLFGNGEHLCFAFIRLKNTSAYNNVACFQFDTTNAMSRTFHEDERPLRCNGWPCQVSYRLGYLGCLWLRLQKSSGPHRQG